MKTQRLLALFIDYLFLLLGLAVLALFFTGFYALVLGGVPEFTMLQTQLLTTFTTVLPAIVIFAWFESRPPFASPGKRLRKLCVRYRGQPWPAALIRNTVKFLPWQLGHMATIYALYVGYEAALTLVFNVASMGLALLLVIQVFATKSGRHLGDLLAGAVVVQRHEGVTNTDEKPNN